MSEETKKVVLECLECRRAELRSGLIAEIVRHADREFLLDFDWSLIYVLSSSKMSSMNEAVAVFSFSLAMQQTLSLELSLPEVEMLLQVLKEIQTCLAD